MHQQVKIAQDSKYYPRRVLDRLDDKAPAAIAVYGNPRRLSLPQTAFLCSKETPGATILKAFDQVAAWRDAGVCVISGFHSPMEQQCLEILLRGKQPVIMALARGLGSLRLPVNQRRAFEDGQLTIISPFAETETRTTKETARQRNRFVAALADEVVFAYVAPGGSLSLLSSEVLDWQIPCKQIHS